MPMLNDYNQQPPDNGESSTTNKLMSTLTSQTSNDATVIQLRLDTEPTVRAFYLNLTGQREVETFDQESGVRTVSLKRVAKPKANEEGIHAIMMFVTSSINVPVVQGNYKEEWWRMYCANRRVDLNDDMIKNQYEWEVEDENYEKIINDALAIIEPYMTRTLENKEREGLGQSTRYVETVGNQQGNNGSGLFGFLSRGK